MKISSDFRDQFDEFFSGESTSRATGDSRNTQSGSHAFYYDEEEEYIENLLNSGNFPGVNANDLKDPNKKSKSSNRQGDS